MASHWGLTPALGLCERGRRVLKNRPWPDFVGNNRFFAYLVLTMPGNHVDC